VTGPDKALRLAFAGTPQFAVPALAALAASRHELAAVFTQPDRAAGRGRSLQQSPVKQFAVAAAIPLYQPQSFREPGALAQLAELGLDALVVVAYGLILPPAALASPRLGCLNIHASLLPRWRGAAPIQRAILAGDPYTGVTIMRMEAGLDTGPALATVQVPIGAADTAASLAERLSGVGAELLLTTLDALAAGTAVPVPQPAEGVTYAAKIDKSEALIDWAQDAAAIARKVRAFNPRPVAETRHQGEQLRIWEATALDAPPGAAAGTVTAVRGGGIEVACGSGQLRVLRLQAPGRKVQDAQAFARATALVGARFGAA
jgi:methionyl-tRNA formyltransferase